MIESELTASSDFKVSCKQMSPKKLVHLDNVSNELIKCRVCSQPSSIEQAVSLFSSMKTQDGDNVVKTILDVMTEFADVTIVLNDDRPKHICSVCMNALDSGIRLQQQIRKNELAAVTTNTEVSIMSKFDENGYEFEYLDEFRDEIAIGTSSIMDLPHSDVIGNSGSNDPIPDDSLAQQNVAPPNKQLTLQLSEEEMEYLHDGMPEPGKFSFEMPPEELIAQQLCFDKFEYLEICGERCCGCAHIAPSRDALMMHAKEMHSQNYYADSNYTCPTCYQKFPTEDQLAKHTQYYSYCDIFLCSVCHEAFIFRSHMMLHLKLEHNHEEEEIEYELESPKKKSLRKSTVCLVLPDEQVIKERQEFPQYLQYLLGGERCCACGLYMECIESHVAEEHQPSDIVDELQCTVCQRTFSSQRLLILHEQERKKLDHLYECRHCGELFSKKYSLLQHLQNKRHPSRGKDNVCALDNAKESASVQQTLIVPSPKDVECFCCCFRRCKEEFATEVELLAHADQVHAGRRKENEIKLADTAEHVCTVCLLLFESAEKLQQHRSYKMQVDKQRCNICGRMFMRPSGLREHQEREHLDLPPRYACEMCGKHFITRSILNQHRRIHAPFANCPCDAKDCDLVFRDVQLMRRHFRNVHAENKPYSCRHCQKVFRTKESLDIHERCHTGERPFPCRHEGCNKRYAHGTDRLRHERSTHTGERPHECTVCNASFFRRRELRMHTEKLHKEV